MGADLVHFDIPADDPDRLADFYAEALGWDVSPPVPGFEGYRLVKTSDTVNAPGGGIGPKGAPEQVPVNYFGVASIEESSELVKSAGGTVVTDKMTVPKFGYLMICTDPEGNPFGLWVEDANAE